MNHRSILPPAIGMVAAIFCHLATMPAAEPKPPAAAIKLFDGKTLGHWKSTEFGGQGDVKVEDGKLVLEMGSEMTGVTWTAPEKLPKINYEISLEAMKLLGDDFFCGLTFPVGDEPLTLIVGGWGGATVGLSSLDDADASSNETTTYQEFDRNKWYKIRLRVTKKKVQAWIDDKKVVDVEHAGRKLSIRSEVDLSRPLGVCTWLTSAALRNIELRQLPADAE